jgi:hypothetical protein
MALVYVKSIFLTNELSQTINHISDTARDLETDLSRNLGKLDYALKQAIDGNSRFEKNLARNVDLIHSLRRDLGIAGNLLNNSETTYSYGLIHNLVLDTNRDLDQTLNILRARLRAHALATDLVENLEHNLSRIKTFTNDLYIILGEPLVENQSDINYANITVLENFRTASNMLQACLEISAVPNRKVIYDRMYVPPPIP